MGNSDVFMRKGLLKSTVQENITDCSKDAMQVNIRSQADGEKADKRIVWERELRARTAKVCNENLPLLERRVEGYKSGGADVESEFVPASKGKKGRIARKIDETTLEEISRRIENKQITLYGYRYAIRAVSRREKRAKAFEKVARKIVGKDWNKLLKYQYVFDPSQEEAQDEKILQDFQSEERDKIREHLDGMAMRILGTDLAWGMLNKHWMADHAAELDEALQRCKSFEELLKENDWYSNMLPEDVGQLLKYKLQEASLLREAMDLRFRREGIDPKTLSFMQGFPVRNGGDPPSRVEFDAMIREKGLKFQELLENEKAAAKDLSKKDVERGQREKKQAEKDRTSKSKDYAAAKASMRTALCGMDEEQRKRLGNVLKDVILDGVAKSAIAQECYDAARELYRMLRRLDSGDSDTVSLEEMTNTLLRAESAFWTYRDSHNKTWYSSATTDERLGRASSMTTYLAQITQEVLTSQHIQVNPLHLEQQKKLQKRSLSGKLRDKCIGDLENLKKAYDTWKGAVARDLLDSPEQRLIKLRRFFAAHQGILEIWGEHREELRFDLDPGPYDDILSRAELVDRQLLLVGWAKEKGDKRKIQRNIADEEMDRELDRIEKLKEANSVDGSVDEEVTDDQAASLEPIDRWLLRNADRGFIVSSNAASTVNNILSRTKRERLYIYYLVATKTYGDAAPWRLEESQDHAPLLTDFKAQMLRHKANVYARFVGGEVMWERLRQAVALCDQNRSVFKEKWEKKDPQQKRPEDPEEVKARKEAAENFDKAVKAYRDLVDGKSMEELERQKSNLKAAADQMNGAARHLFFDIMKFPAQTEASKEDARVGDMVDRSDGEFSFGLESMALSAGQVLEYIDKLGAPFETHLALGSIGAGLDFLSGMAEVSLNIISLGREGKDLSWGKYISRVANIGSGGVTMASGALTAVNNIASQFTNLAQPVAATGAIVASGVSLAAGMLELGVELKQLHHQSSASKHLQEKYKRNPQLKDSREEKYDRNLLKLNKRLQTTNMATTGLNIASSGVSLAGAILAPLGIGIALTAVSVGIGILGSLVSCFGTANAMQGMFDEFFEVDRMTEIALAGKRGWKPVRTTGGRAMYLDRSGRYHEKRELPLSDSTVVDEIKESVRDRIAGKYGYINYKAAVIFIARKYADFILGQIKRLGHQSEDAAYYIDLIKAFGLVYEPAQGDQPGKPSPEVLAMKLMGR